MRSFSVCLTFLGFSVVTSRHRMCRSFWSRINLDSHDTGSGDIRFCEILSSHKFVDGKKGTLRSPVRWNQTGDCQDWSHLHDALRFTKVVGYYSNDNNKKYILGRLRLANRMGMKLRTKFSIVFIVNSQHLQAVDAEQVCQFFVLC